jgi:hypothetical protein
MEVMAIVMVGTGTRVTGEMELGTAATGAVGIERRQFKQVFEATAWRALSAAVVQWQ